MGAGWVGTRYTYLSTAWYELTLRDWIEWARLGLFVVIFGAATCVVSLWNYSSSSLFLSVSGRITGLKSRVCHSSIAKKLVNAWTREPVHTKVESTEILRDEHYQQSRQWCSVKVLCSVQWNQWSDRWLLINLARRYFIVPCLSKIKQWNSDCSCLITGISESFYKSSCCLGELCWLCLTYFRN